MTESPRDIPQSLQELPPKWAHFCLHVEQFVKDELEFDLQGKTLVIGFSGGVDSTALLLCLYYLSKKHHGQVLAVHLNHQLRPEADDDARWVEKFCSALNIDVIMQSLDVKALAEKHEIGLEEAGRTARYDLFKSVLVKHDEAFIALGHHLDDLCEDVLMRLMRGTAWPGLAGMSGYDNARKLIRPFLLTPKSKLQSFLTDISVGWREDSTNADPAWTRNRVRSTLLPLFLKENPNFPESVARLWKVGKIDQDYWEEVAGAPYSTILHKTLEQSHKAARLRMFKAALDALDGGQALADTLFKLDKAWLEKRVGATFQFPGDKTATIKALGVVFSSKH